MYYQNTLHRAARRRPRLRRDSLIPCWCGGSGAAAPDQRFAPARNTAGCLPDSLGGDSGGGAVPGMGAVGFAPAAIACYDLAGETTTGECAGCDRRSGALALGASAHRCSAQRSCGCEHAASSAEAALLRSVRQRTERSAQRPAQLRLRARCLAAQEAGLRLLRQHTERSAQRPAQPRLRARCQRRRSGALALRSSLHALGPLAWTL
jgi:hypothetical protein